MNTRRVCLKTASRFFMLPLSIQNRIMKELNVWVEPDKNPTVENEIQRNVEMFRKINEGNRQGDLLFMVEIYE